MFGKKDHHRPNPLVTLFRLLWSLIVIIILGIGLIQAYKGFSGFDPLKLSPASVKNLFSQDGIYAFVSSLLSFNPTSSVEKAKQILGETPSNNVSNTPRSAGAIDFKFAIIADSHIDTQNLAKALNMAKSDSAKFIIGIGDFSDVGTLDQLRNTKAQFDTLGLPYYVTAGDHDLWDSRNKKEESVKNFSGVFGNSYQSFTYNSTRIMLINNADNYLGLDEFQIKWVEEELERYAQNPTKLFFVITGTPLYHPSSDHFMGKVTPKLKGQADHLISILKRSGTDEVFSADTHFFSRYQDPASNLKMTTVGAVTLDRNPQTPRFAIVDVYTNGSYNVEETEIK